jgi:hypothetical protein
VLEVTRFDGERLFPEGAATALAAVASPATRATAVAVNDHLIAAADNHPREDAPLDFSTEYAEAQRLVTLRVQGSVLAAGYLLFLFYLQMTQSRR